MRIGAISFDFWQTLYFHVGTADFRTELRVKMLEGEARRLGLSHPSDIADAFFETADTFIKARWKQGLASCQEQVVQHLTKSFDPGLSAGAATALLHSIYDLYVGPLKPEPADGAREILTWAAARWPVYLVSDTYTLSGHVIDCILERDGLKDVFSGRFYSDELATEKPDILALTLISKELAIPLRSIIHVGDLLDRDGALARAAGCRCILVTSGNCSVSSPSIVQCTSLRQIPEILND